MKYMAMIFIDESSVLGQPQDRARLADEYARFTRQASDAGVLAGSETLQPGMTATVVRMMENGANVTDGPFNEPDGVLGGFYILECENLDQAIEWAAKIPDARWGAVEIRPVIHIES